MSAAKKVKIIRTVEQGVVEIKASCGVTINIGNYESQRYDLSITTRVPESASFDEVVVVTNDLLAKAFDREGKKIYVKITEFLEGLK